MRAPTVKATLQRRILVNYRVQPDALTAILPPPFRPALVHGYGIAGICLIRLGDLRLAGFPALPVPTTENMAHRIAVEWDSAEGPVNGVYIPRRDTSSLVTKLLGGRAFPGWHHLARFGVEEHGGRYRVDIASRDGEVQVAVAAHRADDVSPGSVFGDVEEASAFFRCAPMGYAATPRRHVFDGVTLTAEDWSITALYLDELRSSFFDDPGRFPPGTASFDSAFLMADLETTWQPQPALRAPTAEEVSR